MYGDSYRSPWTNKYFPALEQGDEEEAIYPSQDLLVMEQTANEVFARYAKMYYDNNVSTSVYFFDTDDNGFGSCWLVKKTQKYGQTDDESVWDATHVVKTTLESATKARYKITSNVFLTLQNTNDAQGKLDMAGNVQRSKEETVTLNPKNDASSSHVGTIGRLIEQNEGEIRQELNGIFINKSKQIIMSGRLREDFKTAAEKGQNFMLDALKKNV